MTKNRYFFTSGICKLSKTHYLCTAIEQNESCLQIAKIAQLVEHDLAPKDQTRSDLGKEINEKEFSCYQQIHIAKIAQLVEHDLAKVGVAGSSPVFRSLNEQRNVRVSLFFSKVESKFINCPNGGIGRHASFRDQWP